MMTEEALKSMESSAPMLVAEVRRLQSELEDITRRYKASNKDAMRILGDYEELTEAIAVIVNAVAKEE